MKIFIYILFLFLLLPDTKPEKEKTTVKWYSLQEAFDLQKTKPKKILVDVYTDWCGWCKKMDKETFTNEVVAKYMNDNFYCVKFNAEGNDTIVFMGRKFVNKSYGKPHGTHQFTPVLLNGRISYPSYVFLNEQSKGITVVKGYQPKAKWMTYLRYVAKNKYKTMTYQDYYKAEEAD
jgi:thioredoxin-related protein